jgi:transglutaminase-like putative cysteine protease
MRSDDGLPAGDSAWSISISYQVEALGKGAVLFIPPPWDTQHARLYSQSLSHPGLRQRRTKSDKKDRNIALTAPEAGHYTIESVFNIYVSQLPLSEPRKTGLTEKNRGSWLASSTGVEVNTLTTDRIVGGFTHNQPDPERLIELLFNFVSNNIRIDPAASNASEVALTSKRATALGSTRALLALLRSAHLPARIVTGVDLQTSSRQPHYWAEVYDGEKWLPLDPVSGYLNELPIFYIPLRKGDNQLIISEYTRVISTNWVIAALPTHEGRFTSDTRKPTDILDLTRLSPAGREILSSLLLLPIGVLTTELLRQFAGIRTYGTFTPTLFALAITQVYWITAIIVLLLVTFISVAIRAAMPDLNLQRTPRLAIVFTLVAMSMSIVVSGINYYDPGVDNTVTLLPLVILTMLVDRIYTVYDERGLRTAIVRLAWTVIAAIISLSVLLQTHWGTWLVSYPEMHAITLAIVIFIGLYHGPKLSALPSFAWLKEPSRTLRDRKTDKRQPGQSGDSV